MPDRYWVGGTGSWDTTNTTNWSATSGGGGGASVPTSADDVFFNGSSGVGTVSVAAPVNARSLAFTGYTGTFAGSNNLSLYGGLTLSSGMTFSYGGTVYWFGTGTLTSSGKVMNAAVDVAGGGTCTLGDAIDVALIIVSNGTFDTAGYSVRAGQLTDTNSGQTKTYNLGASAITLYGTSPVSFVDVSPRVVVNAGTSQITCTSTSTINFRGAQATFYNVSFDPGSASSGNTVNIQPANTFNNLSISARTNNVRTLVFQADQTVTGTLTCAGSSPLSRIFVRSTVLGTVRTITAAAVSANDCDFRDITIAGAAAPISPTRAGDCGGNSGITFPAAKTVYRIGTGTSWNSAGWALTSNGSGSADNFPLAQDTAVIDNGTTLTGTLSLVAAYNYPALDASTRTTGITLSFGAAVDRYGGVALGSGVTVSGTSLQTFSGRSTMVFTSAGKTITFQLSVVTPSGTFQLGDAFVSSNSLSLTEGTFNANNYNVTCTTFTTSGSAVRTLTMGSGLWTLSGTTTVWSITATGLTLNKDTANILLSNTTTTARTFSGAALSYNKLTIGGATGVSTLTLTGAMSFTELASTKTVAHTIRLSTDLGTIDTWSVTGTAGNVVTLNSTTTGTRRTFNLSNSTAGLVDYMAVQDIGVNQANTFYVGGNSTNNGNNLNVIFSSIPVADSTGNMFMLFH